MILDVCGLVFSYSSRQVLREVCFRVHEGELLAILGPNGVGKTTLLKCLNAVFRPSAGSVLVQGQDVLSLSSLQVAQKVGYVAQRTESARITVFDAVLMGRKPHLRWKVGEQELKMVEAAIRRLNLQDLSMRYMDELSGGELQKVAIARTLVQEPRLLLLDEPTSALDLKNQFEILELIRRVVSEHQVAAVMTMHNLNSALRFADKYIFLKNGEVFAAGKVEEVTSEMVTSVYGLPVEIHKLNGYNVVVPAA